MRNARWLRLLAYVTGSVNQELLARNEYLATENRILRAKLPSRRRLSNLERTTLAEIGKRLGRKALGEVAAVAKLDTILAWYRRLVAQKFDGSKHRQYPGRPPVSAEVEALVVRMARENSGWGYDRIVGALANLGHHVSDQTVGNMLRSTRSRHQILCCLSIGVANRRSENDYASGEKPQPECLRGTLGSLSEAGVPLKAHSVRARPALAGADRILCALSRRTRSPRERQPAAFSTGFQQL